MTPLRWAMAVSAVALALVGIGGFARQQQFDALPWGSCGKHRTPCIKGLAGPGAPWAMSYIAARRELLFVGGMGEAFDVVVGSAVRRFPQTQRLVVVASPGGSTNAVVRAAKQLRRRNIGIRIEGDCASACALLWALVDSRQATPKARVGLHAGRAGDRVLAPLGDVSAARGAARFEAALRAAGFPPEVIQQGLATPHGRIYWIDVPAMRRTGVKSEWIGGSGITPSASDPPLAPQS